VAVSAGPAAVTAVARGDVGSSQDSWSKFYAGGEIASAAAAKDVAASVAQQLKYVSVTNVLQLYRFRSSTLTVFVTDGCLRRAHCFGDADLGVFYREATTSGEDRAPPDATYGGS
jgi:hypothetical protein